MPDPTPTSPPALPARVVVGGYSLGPGADDPQAGTGLRVLDLGPIGAGTHPYATVGHEALASPTWVVRHPRRPWLVSVGETSPSELVCSRLEPDGSLTVLDRRATGGDSGCHLVLVDDGRRVVVAHYGSGTLESFGLDDRGRVTGPLGRFVSRAPLGPEQDRQAGPHLHQVVLDPARDELLVCDLGTDRVHQLRLAPDGGLAEAGPALVLPPGSGPRHLVLAGDTLVVACELSVELVVARRDAAGWRATQTVPATTATAAERRASSAPVLPSAVVLAGEEVVVATRGLDRLGVFALDRSRGTLDALSEVSSRGHHPRDVVVADGLVWVANQWSDEVVALDLAAVRAGREEEAVARIAVPRPACLVLLGQTPGDGGGRRSEVSCAGR